MGLLPFILAALSGVHLLFLHQTGSSNPLGVNRNLDKSPFHPYFSLKDTFGVLTFMALLLSISFIHPWDLGDPENFIPANPMVTPFISSRSDIFYSLMPSFALSPEN